MQYTNILPFKGTEDIKENWKEYQEIFLRDGLLIFRGAHFNLTEQKAFQKFLGTSLGCYPSEADSEEKHYIEDHAIVQQTIKANNEEVLLNWHIEHAQYDNPMTLGVWIMEIFKTDKKNGNTVFVDVTKLYQNLPQEDKDFLKNSTVEFPLDMFSITTPVEDDPFIQKNILSGPFIREHWITKEPIVRISFWVKQSLHKIEGRDPSEEEYDRFNRLFDYFWEQVKNNKDNWVVQQWEEGDLLIVDLEKMAHTVLGGFKSEDRILRGNFSHEKNYKEFPLVDFEGRKKKALL